MIGFWLALAFIVAVVIMYTIQEICETIRVINGKELTKFKGETDEERENTNNFDDE